MPGFTTRQHTLILLYVKTRNEDGTPIQFIENGSVNENTVKANVFLTDTSGDAIDNDPTEGEFISNVKKPVQGQQGQSTVTWVGAVSNHVQAPRDFVIITNIEVTEGNGISSLRRLPADGYGSYYEANVNQNAIEGAELRYKIYFNVWCLDENVTPVPKAIYLDPILKIH